jgi:CheY-like chemotaxis protein
MSPQVENDPPATILVVDDESAIRELAASILAAEGYTVVQASDGLAAWDVVNRGGVDLVLSDIMMSRLDGHGLLERLRAHGYTLPVVLMSAVTISPDGKEPGVRFLPKPFDVDQLCQTVATALRAAGESRASSGATGLWPHLVSFIA